MFVLSLTFLYLTTQLNQDQLEENVPKNTQLSNQAMNLHLYPDSILVSWPFAHHWLSLFNALRDCNPPSLLLIFWRNMPPEPPPPPPPCHPHVTPIPGLRDLQNSMITIIFCYNIMSILSIRPGMVTRIKKIVNPWYLPSE